MADFIKDLLNVECSYSTQQEFTSVFRVSNNTSMFTSGHHCFIKISSCYS